MWNFKENRYHQWLEKEGILAALSPVVKGNRAVKMEEKGGACEIAVGIGLHDSSAAIIPYLASFREPFVIVSTGTWTISLNPFNSELPQKEDLVKGGLSYLTYEGDPVKVSMLFAGHHHDQQINRIAGYFDVQADDLRSLQYDPVLIRSIRENMQDDLLFNVTPGSNVATEPCVFHLRNLSRFNSAAQAYHCLVRDVIDQQAVATKTILSNSNVKKMYVDGGFCKNAVYMQLLSDAFPEMEVYSSSLIQGTALGAALAIHQEWNARELPDTLIKLKRWPKSPESVVQSD